MHSDVPQDGPRAGTQCAVGTKGRPCTRLLLCHLNFAPLSTGTSESTT